VAAETGRRLSLGVRNLFFQNEAWAPRLLASWQESIEIARHVAFHPSVALLHNFAPASPSISAGKIRFSPGSTAGTSDPYTLTRLRYRGYTPTYVPQTGLSLNGEFHFPLLRIYRGISTDPFYLEQITGYGFGEASYMKFYNGSEFWLPSAGAGFKFTARVLRVPFITYAEFQNGLDTASGGGARFVWGVGMGSLF
jgi:hypothetical protein